MSRYNQHGRDPIRVLGEVERDLAERFRRLSMPAPILFLRFAVFREASGRTAVATSTIAPNRLAELDQHVPATQREALIESLRACADQLAGMDLARTVTLEQGEQIAVAADNAATAASALLDFVPPEVNPVVLTRDRVETLLAEAARLRDLIRGEAQA